MARYISVISDIYPIFSSSKISDIFDIFKVRYFPYFFQHYLLLDVKTSPKCENRHIKFSILFILFNFTTFLPRDAPSAKRGIAIVIILSSPILKYTT